MNKKYISWFCGEKLGVFDAIEDAKDCIYQHPNYVKSKFTKKGDASSRNLNEKEYYRIYDNEGAGWYIR